MAAQTSIQDKRKSKGRKRRECQRIPAKKQSSITFGSELWKEMGFPWYPKLTSFWLHFTSKNTSPQVAKFQAIMVLTSVWCSSIFYVWVSAADSWWQPKQASKIKGKARVGREENTSEHPEENNPSITFGSESWKEIGFPNWYGFDKYTLHYKNAVWNSQKGPLHELPHFRQWKKGSWHPSTAIIGGSRALN